MATRVWQPRSGAIFQHRFGCKNTSVSSMFLAPRGKFSDKMCLFGSLNCYPYPYMSPIAFCSLPQHDAATTMLRSRGAIKRVMSCAQFLPIGELFFMAESTVSISSKKTLLPLAFLGLFCSTAWIQGICSLWFFEKHLTWQLISS